MAFNNVGQIVTLGPGQVFNWFFQFNGEDHGTQLATADVKPSGSGPQHVAFNFGKSKDGNGFVTYFVSIQNVGNEAGSHNLQGGGMS
ncbi:hypothetical protein [Streptomyces luteireticuli]|uniref:Uncharacterized protein n=1 Tax=Streptomyces luteireticuli TaxID=173858 RepID=A0ABP3ITK1_9ACTN